MGASDIELWVNSWNTKYPIDTLYISYENEISDKFGGEDYDGWYVGASEDSTTSYGIYLQNKTGYNETLYFPHHETIEGCSGYRLASPGADSSIMIMTIFDDGGFGDGYYDYESTYALRPVIKLPTSVVNQ